MNYERLRKNIEYSLLSIITEATGSVLSIQQSKDSAGEIIKLVKAEIESSIGVWLGGETKQKLPETKSLEEVSGLISQVNGIIIKWLNDSRACCTNYEDRIKLYNEYWQEIVDIVKQTINKGK